MYIADIPEGMSEASYFYKNSAIYFRDGMGLGDLEKFAVHELIHNLQEKKDAKGNLIRLGLCTFKGSKISGMALNEAAVQLLASNILGYTFENVTYYDNKVYVSNDNKNYKLIRNNEEKEFAKGLVELLNDKGLREEYHSKASKRVKDFDVANILKQFAFFDV